MKILILILMFFCSITALHGQITMSGVVLDKDSTALEEVSVLLLALPDSTVYSQSKSDRQGRYIFHVDKPGNYTLEYSSLGFSKSYGSRKELGMGTHIVEPVILYSSDNQIAEVRVVGKQPGIRQYVDKMVVDVEGSVLSEGNNLLELLEKTPGILSDGKGAFSIQGRAGAKVRIDGRDTYLSGAQLASLLRGMQASDVAKLELMSNPSAREDAAGTAGIINIVTKRNKRYGFGGDVFFRGSQSRNTQGAMGAGIHYRIDRLNLYVNTSIGREQSEDSTLTQRMFYDNGQIISSQKQVEKQNLDPGKYHSIRTGASYEFNNGGVLDASFSWLKGRFITRSGIEMVIQDDNDQQQKKALTNNHFDETYNN
ncbi:MAG: carboxypeptidase regulatory-like domain-containing protein, partial [Sphingobacterium sp.]